MLSDSPFDPRLELVREHDVSGDEAHGVPQTHPFSPPLPSSSGTTSSVLAGSNNPSIHGGTFNAVTIYQGLTSTESSPAVATATGNAHLEGFNRLMQAVSPNAFYDTDDRPHPPKCHKNTRIVVIDMIMDWVTGVIDAESFMLWLHGPAGAGKTAIARSIAELCKKQGLLLASFLFFRSDSRRNIMNPLIANIAYCVACAIPRARELIEFVIAVSDPLILSFPIEIQLIKLVVEPLSLLFKNGYFLRTRFPPLVVIDGLDECLDKDAQTNLILLLSSSASQYHLPLKFLLVSRPEVHINLAVSLAAEQSTVSRLELNNRFRPDQDIHLFLTDKFHEIHRCHPFRSQIPALWPSEWQIGDLVHKASGQFIYVSLAVGFIKSAYDSPMRQLDIVLGIRQPVDHDHPFAKLDTLYASILSGTKNVDLVLRILGVHTAFVQVGNIADINVIEAVLGLEDGDVRLNLGALSSLLEFQEYDNITVVELHHFSFTDFLRTPERSKNYCIDDLAKYHSLIMQWVFQCFVSNGSGLECQQSRDKKQRLVSDMNLRSHLTNSLWTPELEQAVERFSLGTYLGWLESFQESDCPHMLYFFPETFLNHLNDNKKHELYCHHTDLYLKHAMSSIDNHRSSEKYHLLITVWFVLQGPFTLRQEIGFLYPAWRPFCIALFGFDSTDVDWDFEHFNLMRGPTEYIRIPVGAIFGHITDTKRLVPEPILSHRLACVAISCMRYLDRQDPKTPSTKNHLFAWAFKSKRSPWLCRRRMRVTSTGRQPNPYLPTYSFPQSLRRSRQVLYSERYQSENFYQTQHIFYIWTLDLLYHTLRKALKSEELTKALSKSFIPFPALFIHPRRIRRVREAIDDYLEKVDISDHCAQIRLEGTEL